MDNASKALIIAGAILIAVMLVSLGVMLYQTAAGVAENTVGTVEALGVTGYNSQFTQYMGNNKKASVAQGLIDKVIANNANADTTITVKAVSGGKFTTANSGTSDATTLTTIRNAITSKDTVYNITVTGYDSTGVITEITITGASRGTAAE